MSENAQVKGELTVSSPAKLFYPVASLPFRSEQLHESPAVYSSITPNTPEQKMDLYDLMIEGGDNANDWVGTPFEIKDILIHPVVKTDPETGEQTPLPRVVILTESGDRIQFASNGIWSSLVMMQVCGIYPFGGLKQTWKIARVAVGPNKSMFKLLRVPADRESTPANATKSKK